MSRITSYDLQYPRKKHIIYNLSQLLNQKPPINPQFNASWRMVSQQNKQQSRHTKTANLISRNTKNQNLNNMNNLFKRKQLKINFQHYRSKSSIKSRHSQQENKIYQDKNSIKLKNKNNWNLPIFSISNSPSIQGIGLQKSYKSQQLLTQNSLKKNQNNYAFRQQLFATQKYDSHQYGQNIFGKNIQLKKKASQPIFKNQSHSNIKSNKQQQLLQRKMFLKKGSSLQKQIVVNLLRNKMIKEYQYQVKKQYSSKDILSMVKLYKGTNISKNKNTEINKIQETQKIIKQSNNKKQKMLSCPLKILQKFQKPIQGWQIQPQFQIQQERTQENKQNPQELKKIN